LDLEITIPGDYDDLSIGRRSSGDSLPSYSIVTGLPTYEEALALSTKGGQGKTGVILTLSAGQLAHLFPSAPPSGQPLTQVVVLKHTPAPS